MKQTQKDTNTQRFPIRYAFYDRTNIQNFLEQKSEEGWMLQSFNKSTFLRTEPKKRHFSIVYYSDKAAKGQSPYERKQEFLEYCRHDGWELVTQNDRMMIFCSELDFPTPIETDPLMEVKNIHAVAKGHFGGNLLHLFSIAVFWLSSVYLSITHDLSDFLSSGSEWVVILILGISLFISTREAVIYYRWYHAAKAAAKNGQYWDPPKRSEISRVVSVMQSICLIIYIFSKNDWPFMMLFVLGITAIVLLVRWILKKCNISDDIRGAVALLVCFPLCMGVFLLGVFFAAGETAYENLPLSICDLTDADLTNYTANLTKQGTFLVSQQTGKHRTEAIFDGLPEIYYTVTTVHAPPLYDACAKDLMGKQNYISTNADPWDANTAYWDAQDRAYILFYDDRIVEIRFNWEPTAEQMAIVGQKLGGE